jgi:ATP-binding cassette subfamily B protein
MKLLLRCLKPRAGLFLLALFCAACSQGLILLEPWILRHIIDDYATQAARFTAPEYFLRSALLLGAALVAALLAWVAKSFQLDAVNRTTRGVGLQLYGEAVRHSLGMPYSAFEAQRSGEIMAMIQTARNDVEKLLPLLINNTFTAMVAVVFVIVYAARISWVLAPALILSAPLLGFASISMGGRVRETQRRIVDETAQLAGSATESLRNIEIVKSLGLARQEASRLDERGSHLLQLERKKIRHLRNLTFFHGACVNLLRSALLFLFFYLVFSRQITMGQFFSLFFYSYFIFSPMQELGTVAAAYQEAEASMRNIRDLLDMPQEHRPAHPPHIGRIETVAFRAVTFHYSAGDEPAVRDVSFEAARGETVAFVGPSGSGKTTLVKLLVGLYTPELGEVAYNSLPLRELDLDTLRRRIGIVTQDPQLFAGSIRDNMIFVRPEASDAECLDALRQAAATGLLERGGRGLDTLIGEGGLRVSGGEKQRVSIARALLRGPELLVFDEATSSLDSLTEEQIIDTMRSIHQRRSAITLMISHRLASVRHADRIHVLDRGTIVESGSHEELLRGGGLYRDLWLRQTSGNRA